MSLSDPLGDMLTRIRNGQMRGKDSVLMPASRFRGNVLDVLQREGYIKGFTKLEIANNKNEFRIELKYVDGQPVIKSISRVSKPGRRIFSSASSLPKINNGLGIAIVSTPQGVMTDVDARKKKLGGEIICKVF